MLIRTVTNKQHNLTDLRTCLLTWLLTYTLYKWQTNLLKHTVKLLGILCFWVLADLLSFLFLFIFFCLLLLPNSGWIALHEVNQIKRKKKLFLASFLDFLACVILLIASLFQIIYWDISSKTYLLLPGLTKDHLKISKWIDSLTINISR